MEKIDALLRATFAFLFIFSVCFGSSAQAAINPQIDFYGTLQDDSGVNLTGTYDIVFRLYDAPTGGTLLGTNTHTAANGNAVDVRNGKFAVVLGSGTGNSLTGIDFNSSALYVGLTIESDTEMIPRERLTAAPYAFNAEKIEGYSANQLLRYNATGSMTQSSTETILTLRQNGVGNILSLFGGATEMFTVLSNGNVGIGTTTPGRDLTVAGDVQLTGGFYDSFNTTGTFGMVLQTSGTTTRWVATSTLGITGGGGSSLFTDGGATTYLTALGDNLAIGTTTATAKLFIQSDPGITDVFAIAYSSGASLLRLQANGDVAIGFNATLGDASFANYLTAIGDSAGVGATFAYRTNLLGKNAGYGADSIIDSNVIGVDAGYYATSSDSSNFLGYQAGYGAGYASDANFIGRGAGYNSLYTSDVTAIGNDAGREASDASFANFFGVGAGSGASTSASVNFIGEYAGSDAAGVYNATFIGGYSGASARLADNSIFIGAYAGQNDTVVNGGTDTSILIGENTGTGGFSNSIAIGARVQNSAASQLNVGNLLYGTGIYSNFVRSGDPVAGGRIGIGTSTPTAQLTTTGTVRFAAFGAGTLQTDASGNLSVSSDERLKDIQGEFMKGLETLALINPIQYTWKASTGYDTANIYTGFSAQNIQEVLPEAVGQNSDGYLSLSDRPLLATVINAIKEIYAWMKSTDDRVESLESQVDYLQAEINALKAGKTQSVPDNPTANPAPIEEPEESAQDIATSTPEQDVPAQPVESADPSETVPESDGSSETEPEPEPVVTEPTIESL